MGISALLASQILDASATGRSVLTGADASAIRTTLGLGTLATQSPTGTPSASTFLRGDYSWQTIDLSGYVPYSGATGALNLGANALTAGSATFSGNIINTSSGNFIGTLNGAFAVGGFANSTTIRNGIRSLSSDWVDIVCNGNNQVRIKYANEIQFDSSKNLVWMGSTDFLNASILTGIYPSSGVISIRNAANAQKLEVYGTYTDASNYRRLFLSSTTAGAFTLGVEGAGTGASGNTLTLGNPVSVTGGTITASSPAINVSQTWNNAATTFTGILANVTDTASNAASLLMDLQVGGTSKFRVRKGGEIVIAGGSVFRPIESGSGASKFAILQHHLNVLAMFEGQTDTGFAIGDTAKGTMNGAWVNLAGAFGWYGMDGSTPDVRLLRDAAQTLAQRNGLNPQVHRIYNTYTDASNYERAKIAWESNVLRIGTEKAGTGSARALELQTDGVTRLTIGTTGLFTIADALNIAIGTTTGTKIGTATTQKLGFYNATPVVQPTAVANATDAASVITQLNALLSRMRDLGLIAT